MRYELRFEKVYCRFVNRRSRHHKYYEFLHSREIRYKPGWERVFGENRSCIYARIGGYVERKRQIRKCFMKGWN